MPIPTTLPSKEYHIVIFAISAFPSNFANIYAAIIENVAFDYCDEGF
jgi:hypothetical protein